MYKVVAKYVANVTNISIIIMLSPYSSTFMLLRTKNTAGVPE